MNEAEQLFAAEWRRRPRNPRAAFGLGLIAVARGDDRAARGFLSAARDSPTVRKPAIAELAARARARSDEAAAAGFEREAAALPNQPVAWPDPLVDQVVRLRAGSQRRSQDVAELEAKGRFREAAQLYLKQVETQPTSRACAGAGVNLARTGDYERGLRLLREAVRLDPDDSTPHFLLAQALYMRAEDESKRSRDPARAREWVREAAEAGRRATRLKADHAGAYLLWGRALIQAGEPVAAIGPLRKGVGCRP